MPVLNHHIVHVADPETSARYYTEILGLGPAVKLGELAVVQVSTDTTLDFIATENDFDPQHYAFLVTEEEFDQIFERITTRNIDYWSDPMHHDPGQTNAWDDGRGVYFNDPDDHRLEIITKPYGSAGTEANHPHPLIAPTIEGTDYPPNLH